MTVSQSRNLGSYICNPMLTSLVFYHHKNALNYISGYLYPWVHIGTHASSLHEIPPSNSENKITLLGIYLQIAFEDITIWRHELELELARHDLTPGGNCPLYVLPHCATAFLAPSFIR